MLAQGVPGSPTRAAFARVGVVKPWVDWEKLTSPFRDGTVLTFPLAAGTLIRGAAQGNSLLRLSLRSEEQDVQVADHRQHKRVMDADAVLLLKAQVEYWMNTPPTRHYPLEFEITFCV